MSRRLAIVVSTDSRADFAAAYGLATAAEDAGVDVSMFFMDAGVAQLPDHGSLVAELHDREIELMACGNSARYYGVSREEANMLIGSQDDHAAMVCRADRTVAFT
jgi:sulfur relay (sulfurtransferase) complex TusBCD TusD component (DsrE family)